MFEIPEADSQIFFGRKFRTKSFQEKAIANIFAMHVTIT